MAELVDATDLKQSNFEPFLKIKKVKALKFRELDEESETLSQMKC